MSRVEEIRRIVLLAADNLDATQDARIKTGYNETSGMPITVIAASAFGSAALRMIAAYITEPEPEPDLRGLVDQILAERTARRRAGRTPASERPRGPNGRYLPATSLNGPQQPEPDTR